MSIGENIKRIRKEKGLTQKELADKCNLSPEPVAQVRFLPGAPFLCLDMTIIKPSHKERAFCIFGQSPINPRYFL